MLNVLRGAALVCVVLACACADDGSRAVGPSGAPPNVVGRPISGGGGSSGAGGSGGTSEPGACDNPEDLEALAAVVPSAELTFCAGLFCLPDLFDARRYQNCVSLCMTSEISELSLLCAVCYGESASCGLAARCTSLCQFNTCALPCLNCLQNAGCLDSFEACRGLPGSGCPSSP